MASPPPQGPTISAGVPAAGVTAKCPYALGHDAAPPAWKQPTQKVVPCDLQKVSVTLSVKGQAITVVGTTPAASPAPLQGVDDTVNKLLSNYAAVIHHVMPAVVAGGAAPSRTNQVTAQNMAEKIRGAVTMQETMRATCGKHAEVVRAPEIAEGEKVNTNVRAYQLEVSPKDWSAWDFLKGIFGSDDLKEFVYPQRKAVAFQANSCAFPANGQPVGHLSAIVEMMIADEWRVDFRWLQGFALNFSASSSHTKDHRDGTKISENKSSLQTNLDKEATEKSSTLMTQDGKTIYAKRSDSTLAQQDPTYANLSTQSLERDTALLKPTESATLTKLKQAQEAQAKKSFNEGLALSVTRNGKAVLDTDQWGETIEGISSKINTVNDLIFRLVEVLENGAKAGIPVSITFGLSLNLRLLQGSFGLRIWPEQVAPRQAGNYYISGYRPRFQGIIDITAFSLTVSPKITFQAKFLHEWVASGTIEISASITGSGGTQFSYSDGMSSVTRDIVGRIRMSVTGKGEIQAASFYAMVEGTASSGMQWTNRLDFDGNSLKLGEHKLKSHRLEVVLTARYGSKVLDFFGVGSDEPDWQWPAAGEPPFVWLEEDAISSTWR